MDNNFLGIFGDSFAHINPKNLIDEKIGRRPWPLTLGMLLNKKLSVHSAVATSTWYSYKKFLKNYHKMDTIVFCYSGNDRWHTINVGDGGPPIHHIVAPEQLQHVDERFVDVVTKLVEVHPYIFDPQLNLFIIQNIFDSVNNICRENNIKIVNVLTFEQVNELPMKIDISNNAGVVLTNLAQIATREYLNKDGSPKDIAIANKISNSVDRRFCHISPYNNAVLATIIKQCLENDIEYLNLFKDDRFSLDIEHNRYLLDL